MKEMQDNCKKSLKIWENTWLIPVYTPVKNKRNFNRHDTLLLGKTIKVT